MITYVRKLTISQRFHHVYDVSMGAESSWFRCYGILRIQEFPHPHESRVFFMFPDDISATLFLFFRSRIPTESSCFLSINNSVIFLYGKMLHQESWALLLTLETLLSMAKWIRRKLAFIFFCLWFRKLVNFFSNVFVTVILEVTETVLLLLAKWI